MNEVLHTYKKTIFVFALALIGFFFFHSETSEAENPKVKSLNDYQYKWKYRSGDLTFDIIHFNEQSGDIIYQTSNQWRQIFELGMLNSKGKYVWKNTKPNYTSFTVKGNYVIGTYDTGNYLVLDFLSKKDGKLKKRISFKPYKILNYKNPTFVVDNKLNVIVASENKLVAVNYQGKRLWEKKETLPKEIHLNLSFKPPIVSGDYVITALNCAYSELCTMLDRDELMVLSVKNGEKIWSEKKKRVGSFHSTTDKKSIVVEEWDDSLTYYNIADGRKIWNKKFAVKSNEYLSALVTIQGDQITVPVDGQGNIYAEVGKVNSSSHFLTTKIYSIDKNGKLRWGSNMSSLKDGMSFTHGFSKDDKILYIKGSDNGIYQLNIATGKLVKKTPFVRKSGANYTKYTQAPLATLTKSYIIGSDYWLTKKNKDILKDVWNSKHTIYNKSGKKIGTLHFTDQISPSEILVTTKYNVYVVDFHGIYAYNPK